LDRIATLGSAANASQPPAGAQSFYTGGAKSGMLVQGRPEEGKQGTGAASLIENILKQAAK
jgi:hypothetical protein